MNDLRHFIIFRRTEAHSATWLVRAPCLYDALVYYALNEYAGARLREDGNLVVDEGCAGEIAYHHPLACIESEEKTRVGWEVRELVQAHWEAQIAEAFCSENPAEVEGHVEACRPLLRIRHPRSRAQGFVWYLHEGPLVTFYRTKGRGRVPIEILGRYLRPWSDWPHVEEWHGTYDNIMEKMVLAYPLP